MAIKPSTFPLRLRNLPLPSAALLFRSLAVSSLLLTSLVVALFAWTVFYSATKVSTIGGRERVWLQYGHFTAPYAVVDLPLDKYVSPNQEYDVTLDLIIPATGRNLELGNFMVSLSLLSSTGEALTNVSRPTSLVHPTPSLLSPLSLVPFVASAQPQRLQVPLLERAILTSRRRRATQAWIEVGRKDAHLVPTAGGVVVKSAGEVQVYEAWLRIDARLTGLRYILYYHPIISFLLFLPTFFLLELFAAAVVWALLISSPSSPPATFRPPPSAYDTATSVTASSPPSTFDASVKEEEEEEELLVPKLERPSERGMREFESETETKTETGTETGTELETGSDEGWEGVGGVGAGEVEEDDDKFDDEGTVGGSETTRGSVASFGPSLAGTTSTFSSSTGVRSGSSTSMRARGAAGGGGARTGDAPIAEE